MTNTFSAAALPAGTSSILNNSISCFLKLASKKKDAVIAKTCIVMLIIFLSVQGYAQGVGSNFIGVSFSDGFVGTNSGQNKATNAVKTSTLGWSNIQFTQNSNAIIFTSQGNDIPGTAIITDNSGVKQYILGFLHWRAPSGDVSTVVFEPSESKTLATNSSNGSSTYVITTTKYIGMTFNGQSLTIPNTLEVTGNAAQSNILSSINDYLAAQPKLSITSNNITVNETAGSARATISLNAVAAVTITVKYATTTGTAGALDFTNTAGTLTFAPGETTKNVDVPILNDTEGESTESFQLIFSDPSNAALIGGRVSMNIIDNDNVDTAPAVITGPGNSTAATSVKSISENSTAVHTFAANETVTWSTVGGADQAKFTLNTITGVLTFTAAPDFEAPTDADANNTYIVIVRATDLANNTTNQTLTVTVTDVTDESAPIITGPGSSTSPVSAKSISENTTAVHTFTANEAVTWTKSGGVDQAKFILNASTGVLTFTAAPDFEVAGDADANNTYIVIITATDGSGNVTSQTLTVTITDVDDGTAPVASLVAITGTETVGQTLTGSYTYSDVDSDAQGVSTFKWLSSATSGGTYAAISGATATTYVLTSTDQGKFIKFEVIPVASTGTPLTGTAVLSSPTSAIGGRAPVASLVAITGTETVGQTLTGSYTYTDADSDAQGTSTFKWLSSATSGGTYTAITGATATTYVLTSTDQGKFLKFEVTPVALTGTPSTGTAVLSSATSAIGGRAPVASLVAITGTETVGQTLTGSYTYTDADSDAQGTSTFKWLSSATSGGTYAAISGATATTYVLTSTDQGKFIKFEVTPVASTGTPLTGTAVLSSATSAIGGRAPVASLVAITGTETVGQTLTGSYTYTDADSDAQGTSTFKWLSSATSGGTYTAITGATATTYVLTSADQGKFIKFEVTPVASTGTPLTGTAVLSSATSAIGGRAPVASLVAITGTETVGQTLTGSYTYTDADGDAQGVSTFKWLSSATSGGTYAAITGATSNTYVLVAADHGKFIKFEVTPVASTGTPLTGTAVLSSATSAIGGKAPVASLVAITGTETVGQTLTGSYTYTDADGDAQGVSTFKWLSSATSGGTYAAISGATATTYVLTSADQGKFIKFEVTPVASTGTPLTGTAVLSSATSAIGGRAPVASLVAITGTETVGQTLTGSYTYTDADGDAQGTSTFKWLSSATSGGTYAAITGATSNTYVLVAADHGKFIKFEVTPVASTGTPLTGTAVLSSATSAIGGKAPVASLVAITGTETVGQTLTGSYTYTDADGDAQGNSTFKWLSSAASGGTYAAITGATNNTYVLVAADQGKFIKFEVTPVASAGTPLTGTAVLSSATSAIGGITVNVAAPIISFHTPVVLTKGAVITPLTPTSTGGTVVNYSIIPALPTGLTLDINTGTITGTPTTVDDQKNYLVTATNSGGSGTFTISIIVNDVAPIVTYNTPATFVIGNPGTIVPLVSGGKPVSFAVDKPLPAGLTLNPTSGVISGTPTVLTEQAIYTVTVTNTGGSKDFALPLAVARALPKLEVILTASTPLKQPDGSFNVDYRVKVSNKGNTILSNLELTVNLNNVFPAPVQFTLIASPKVSGSGDVIPNNTFNGTGNLDLISNLWKSEKVDNEYSDNSPIYIASNLQTEDLSFLWKSKKAKIYTGFISGEGVNDALQLVRSNSGLGLNDTSSVTFSLNIRPNGNFGPYPMNVIGTAQNSSGDFVSETSTDGRLLVNNAITGIRYPTIVSVFPNPLISSSLNLQEVVKLGENSYDVKLRVKVKNSGNLVLSNIKLIADFQNQLKKPSIFSVKSVIGSTSKGLIQNSLFDGSANTNLLRSESAINVGIEDIIDFIINVQPNGAYGDYSLQLSLEGTAAEINQIISNSSYSGLDPDKSLINPANNKATIFNLPAPAPQNLALDNTSFYENNAVDVTIGKFTASDLSNSVLTYTLISGSGDTDNGKFKISGTSLLGAQVFNYEQQVAYSIRVRVTNQAGLFFDNTFSITLKDVNEAPTLNAIGEQRIFISTNQQTVPLVNVSPGPEIQQLTSITVSSDNPSLFDQLIIAGNQLRYKIKDGGLGFANITVVVIDDGNTLNGGTNQISRSFKLTVDPLPTIIASPDVISKGFTSNLQVKSPVQSTYVWSSAQSLSSSGISNPIARPAETTTYNVVVTNQFGNSVTLATTVTVKEDYNITIPNVFSPNGDGLNDKWVIDNISSYPDHTLTLLDRSGRVLRQVRNYLNDWDGTVNGMPLEIGTYYYILRFQKGSNIIKKGFITMVR